MRSRLDGRRALVTGGGSGIGRAIVHCFARQGAAVAVADIDRDAADTVASEVANKRVLAVPVDVTDSGSVSAMMGVVEARFGAVDVLVTSAIRMPVDGLATMTDAEWEDDVRIALGGTFRCVQAVLPGMRERRGGAIVAITSVNGLNALGHEAYSAAKAGVMSLTRSIAVRYGRDGIRANAIAPATVRTPVWDQRRAIEPEIFDKVARWYPAGRVGTPEDVAHAALFLASDEASWITGVTLPVDGGLLAGNYQMMLDVS